MEPVLLTGQLGLVGIQDLERDCALDQFFPEHVQDGLGALLAVGLDLDRVIT
jgi:hypothetical protein